MLDSRQRKLPDSRAHGLVNIVKRLRHFRRSWSAHRRNPKRASATGSPADQSLPLSFVPPSLANVTFGSAIPPIIGGAAALAMVLAVAPAPASGTFPSASAKGAAGAFPVWVVGAGRAPGTEIRVTSTAATSALFAASSRAASTLAASALAWSNAPGPVPGARPLREL